jgi:hypothetical protein
VAARFVVGVARLLLAIGAALTLIAMALGRSAPPAAPGRADREAVPVRVGIRPGAPPWEPDRFLDPAGGLPVAPTLPAGGGLFGSAWAPWADGSGRTQLVGIWRDRRSGDAALVRLSQPDGSVLDRLAEEGDWPGWTGAPCWFPDRSERVLLAGGEGSLHRLDFGDDAPGRGPRPLPWRCDPGSEAPPVRDLAWPRHPRLGGRLLAAICRRKEAGASRPGQVAHALWWLRLDPEASAVVAAGPLVVRPDGAVPADERFPAFSPCGAGPPRVAWLERVTRWGESPWRLRVADVEIDPASGDPSAAVGTARDLAEGCEAVAPTFSADGRRLVYVVRGPGGPTVRWADATEPACPAATAVASSPPAQAVPRGRDGL